RTREQFLNLLDDALREEGTELMRARQESVREGTWDARAEWVSGLIEQEQALLKKREGVAQP
ncbi:MAG TPA: hypothetical protein VGQ72_07350, partial [Pyrinomonadaceae bacterium]|nr:hypothetical protein [Pyrinomonadaceae bacterium]